MLYEVKIWMGNTQAGEKVSILPEMANRHGFIAGATGTGKTVTLKVMAEAFSDMGVPVFLADVKGDIAGMMSAGEDSANMQERIARFGLGEAGFSYQGYPVTFWDIYGKNGIQLRTTISEMGPLLLARILQLNDLQTDILNIVYKIADDNNLLLVDTKDLKSMLNYVNENASELAADYGKISSASLGAITRALVALELEGGDVFFGEPALNINDWLAVGAGGKGMMHILDSSSLINNGRLYSTFLLWMLSELFETLPEVGDMDKPKLVFFFDEAHLLFSGASKNLLEKIEQVVKLIRSKGVGVYFCTQNPGDIPDGVLAQLGNKVQHALHAYTPTEQKAVRAAADAFRANPEFDTYETLEALGIGEAVVSFLDADGVPGIAQRVGILPPASRMDGISEAERDTCIKSSLLYSKYAESVDPDSAYEFLQRRGLEMQAEAEAQAAELAAQKEAEKAEKEAQKEAEKAEKEAQKAEEKAQKEAEKQAEKEAKAKKKAVKQVGATVAGTVGRQVGKQIGKNFGKFGQTLGGNVGASLGRGILSTLFKS
jgi:DNA helicase HerA-like ATPase